MTIRTSTDYPSIQAAIEAARPNGGRIYIPAGNYSIAAPLTLYSNVHLFGDGDLTVITTNQDIEMVAVANGANDARLSNLKLTNTLNGQTKANIHATNPNNLKISKLRIVNAETGSGGGIQIDNGAGGVASGYCTEIGFSTITHGGIEIRQTDAKLYKNWVFAQTRLHAVYLVDCGNVSVDGCDVIGGIGGAGIYAYTSEGTKVHDCLSGSNVAGMDCGLSVVLDRSNYSMITGNFFFHTSQDAIVLRDVIHCSVTGNSFWDCNSLDNGASDIVISGVTLPSNRNVIMGNTHKLAAERSTPGYCIVERNDGQQPTTNIIIGNTGSGNYATPHILADAGSRVRDNAMPALA